MSRTRSKPAVSATLTTREADAEIRRLLAGYTAEISQRMVAARRKLRARIPRGFELIYDTYNGLGVGYGATQTYSAPVVSLLAYPRWVTLFLLHGATLDDPHGLLEGTGSRVRSIRLAEAQMLDDPRVGALVEQALRRDEAAFAAAPALRTCVQWIARVRKPRAPGRRRRPRAKGST